MCFKIWASIFCYTDNSTEINYEPCIIVELQTVNGYRESVPYHLLWESIFQHSSFLVCITYEIKHTEVKKTNTIKSLEITVL